MSCLVGEVSESEESMQLLFLRKEKKHQVIIICNIF